MMIIFRNSIRDGTKFYFVRHAAEKRYQTQSATSSSGHKNAPAKTARLNEPNQRTSKRVPPHERAGKCHLHLESPATPTTTLPQLGQLNMTTGRPTEIATLVPHVGASRGFQHGPWHWPADSRRTGFQATTCPHLHGENHKARSTSTPHQLRVGRLLPSSSSCESHSISVSRSSAG